MNTNTEKADTDSAKKTAGESPYNYRRFRPEVYDLASFDGPTVGQRVENLELMTLKGDTVRLSDFDGRPVVIETGSLTCPMYAKNIGAMNKLAAQHPDVAFVVLYVREAHPGERIRPHDSTETKQHLARSLRERLQERRRVLVDNTEGVTHRALGSLPNMIYVLDADRTVRFRADWNTPAIIESILEETAPVDLVSREHFPPTKPSPVIAIRTLAYGGFLAIADFVVGLPALMRLHRRADRHYSTSQ